jgi:hypothetical protein
MDLPATEPTFSGARVVEGVTRRSDLFGQLGGPTSLEINHRAF